MKLATFIILFLAISTISLAQIVGDYQAVDLNDFQNNPEGQASLEVGVQYCIASGLSQNVFSSDSVWAVSQVNSVEQQIVDGTNWKIDVNVADADNHSFNAQFVVFSDFSVGLVQVISGTWTL